MKNILTILVLFCFLFQSVTAQDSMYTVQNGVYALTKKGATHFAQLPLRCADKAFPYKSGLVFSDSTWIREPAYHHPAFFGCYDWHSSVHGHWLLIRLMRKFPNLPYQDTIRNLFNRHITPETISREMELFRNKENRFFERTYGWAWLLQLQNELLHFNDPDAIRWAAALQPLATSLSVATVKYLQVLTYPMRTGEHSNLAFSLNLMVDYAKHQKDTALYRAIHTTALKFYAADKNCPFSWEPNGADFLSPCLEEATLMGKLLPEKEYTVWLKKFLPVLWNPAFTLEPAIVKDRTDGRLVHLDGLNLSRANCLKQIGKKIGNKRLLQIAQIHLNAAVPKIASGEYSGEHWLASFAVYTLSEL